MASILFLTFFSCEEVIDLDVPMSEPRLVIDASINWVKGTPGNEQEIKLSLSAPYFETEILPATGAQVSISDSNNNEFVFIEEQTGLYKNYTFTPVIDGNYNLTIVYEGDIYTASETLKSVTEIEFVEQTDDAGFSGDETELKAYFSDPADQENFYFFEFIDSSLAFPSLEVYKDEFVNGNQIFGFYSDEDLDPGDEIIIRNHGVSERFYQFMFVLLQQNGENSGGPFETQPATVRGNCINQTNPDKFPFGYFRLSEVDEYIYIIQ